MFHEAWRMLTQSFDDWSTLKGPRLGAALAYYSVFSIAPLLLLVIAVASQIFGADAAQQNIVHEIEYTVGRPVAKAVEATLQNNADTVRSTGATLIGIAMLLMGAAGVFAELQDSLNTIFRVEPKPMSGLWSWIRTRFISLTIVMGTGFLLLVSLVVNTALAALHTALSESMPGGVVVWNTVNVVMSFFIIAVLFALIYKLVPDVRLRWTDVWAGAVLTTFFFMVGKSLLGWYLGQASTTSAYGAAGSLVVILLWVYYASQILLFGAAFTRIFALRNGSHVAPAKNAVRIDEPARRGEKPQAAPKPAESQSNA
jgi:membrane protein